MIVKFFRGASPSIFFRWQRIRKVIILEKIIINGLNNEAFKRPLQLITNLFFENTEVVFANENESGYPIVHFQFKFHGNVEALAHLKATDGKEYFSTFSKENVHKDDLKEMKRMANHVYLSVLEQWTNMKQAWGTLTGIRPTKLMHKFLQEGLDIEAVHERLQKDYLIDKEKTNLMEHIVRKQLQVIPDLYDLQKEVSIYIGIPFCPTKCSYCTFPAYAIQGRQGLVSTFLEGLHYEVEKVGEWLKNRGINVTTIYVGGGTPTSISSEQMDRLFEKVYKEIPNIESVREMTVEAGRPDTITVEKLQVLKKWNVERISVNPQSFIQQTLKEIGRHHTVEETIEKFYLARELGMKNINMDLIIGLPGEKLDQFVYSLNEIEKLMPDSLTVHTLSFKRASQMTKNKERYAVPSREEAVKMMNYATEWTRTHRYQPYYLYRQKNILGNLENVGYSMPNKESIYNILIMEEKQSIIGLGCGAASKFIHPTGKIIRFANPKDPKTYNESFQHYTIQKLKLLEKIFS